MNSSGDRNVQCQLSNLKDAETKFRKACIQIVLLNKQLEDFKDWYSKAKEDNFRSFRYNLRLKLAIIEGVRNMYYDYAYMKAEKVAALSHDLYGETVEIQMSDAESEEEDWKTSEEWIQKMVPFGATIYLERNLYELLPYFTACVGSKTGADLEGRDLLSLVDPST